MSTGPRYSLREAAKVAGMRTTHLAELIRDGAVPQAWYVAPTPGTTRGRYIIFRSHFDRWVGVDADPEPEPEPERAPDDAPNFGPFVKRRRHPSGD